MVDFYENVYLNSILQCIAHETNYLCMFMLVQGFVRGGVHVCYVPTFYYFGSHEMKGTVRALFTVAMPPDVL